MDKLYKLLTLINSSEFENQRDLALKTGLSIGTVNALVKNMEKEGYITVNKQNGQFIYDLTSTGLTVLENMLTEQKASKLNFSKKVQDKIDTAIILAAGYCEDFSIPVGLLKIKETTLIDRMLEMLRDNGITNIIMVVGYKAKKYYEHFNDSDIQFVENNIYKKTGTMHSLSLAKDLLKSDFLLIESDQIFEERAIIELISAKPKVSFIMSPPQGSQDEAYVELDEQGNVYRIAKDIHQVNRIDGEMLGFSKLTYDVYQKMIELYAKSENPYINYEYVLENIGRIYSLKPHVIDDLVWCEIDNSTHYDNAVNMVFPKIIRKENMMRVQYAKDTLKEILGIEEKDILSISFSGGLTNTNYKVNVKNDEYILRISGKGTEVMINRKNERFNGKIGSLLGINCDMVYFNEATGVKLSEYIKDAETLTPKTARMEKNFKQVAGILRKLHTSGVDFPNNFDVFEEAIKYEKALNDMNGATYKGYAEAREEFFKLKDRLFNDLEFEYMPCHNDLVAENLVKNGEGRMYLIDWEYAGMNDPMWDLAAHLLECDFGKEKTESFLEFYFGKEPTDLQREKIVVFMICQDFLWTLWTNIKEAKGVDFGSYGIDRFKNCQKNIKLLKEKYDG